MKLSFDIKENLLLLGVFTLPINQTLNHWFFGTFIFLSFLGFLLDKEARINLKSISFNLLLISAGFFLLRLFTLLYTPDFNLGTKELIRSLPFVLYPIGILTFRNQKDIDYKIFEQRVFWALSIGCLITAIICWGNVIVNMEASPIPANKFFGWKKSGSYLTALLDLHPPYLGMLIFGSIIFLFKEIFSNENLSKYKQVLIYCIILVLLVFLFNITARNTLFFLLTIGLGVFIYKKQWKLLISTILLLSTAIFLILNHPSQYYRLKMYHMLGLSDNDKFQDKRFERLIASYNVFKQNPFFGVGLGKDLEFKIQEYENMGDNVAVKKRLNSHNQFFEYLAAYGIIGGLVFVTGVLSLILFLLSNKYYFYLLLFLNIIFASITESIFERALGIQYFALLVSLVFLKHLLENNQKT